MTSFDFFSYITSALSLDLSTNDLQIHALSGGFTNLTVRAIFDPPVLFHRRSLQSVVLKYAPPYLASDPSQPMSVYRQTIEARALEIFAGKDKASFHGIATLMGRFPKLRVPELVFHDKQSNVLWISDLGKTQTLSEYLLQDVSDQVEGAPTAFESIAEELGYFLAELYRVTKSPPADVVAQVSNPSTTGEIFKYLAKLTRDTLIKAEVPDAEVLSERVLRAFSAKKDESDICLGMVDMWPESVLVDAGGRCGLVDWEYFGVSSAASELGMFIAHLHIHMLNSTSSRGTVERMRSFVSSFLFAYSKHAPAPSPSFKRRALRAHGREMVNGVEFYGGKLDDESKISVVQAGARSLRAAAESDSDVDLSVLVNGEEDTCASLIQEAFVVLGF